MNHKITPEIDRMIADHYLQHKNAPLLSRETGISQSAIYSSLRRQGIQRERQGGRSDAERDRQIVALFQELKSTRLVVDRMRVPMKTVHYVLKKAGIPTPRTGRRQWPYAACDSNSDKILSMCQAGHSLKEMADAVGTTGVQVKKFLRRHGITKEFPKATYGEKHYAWKGRFQEKDGYVVVHCKGHPNARKHTHYIFEHRLVMEEAIGRFLLPTEVVHHVNGVKNDNRIENLQLFDSNGEHLAHELNGRCPKWSDDGKERIRKSLHQRWSLWRSANQKPSEDDAQPCI
jgi:hypothetical protein